MARRFLPVILPASCCSHRRRADRNARGRRVWRRCGGRTCRASRCGSRWQRWLAVELRRSSRPVLHARRVRRAHRAHRVARLADRDRRPPDRRVAQRIRRPRARPAARLHLRQAGARPELAQAGQAGVCEVPRLGAAAVSPGVFPRRRRHRSAVARRRRPVASERFQVPDYEPPATRILAACDRRSSISASTNSRRRHPRAPATASGSTST